MTQSTGCAHQGAIGPQQAPSAGVNDVGQGGFVDRNLQKWPVLSHFIGYMGGNFAPFWC